MKSSPRINFYGDAQMNWDPDRKVSIKDINLI